MAFLRHILESTGLRRPPGHGGTAVPEPRWTLAEEPAAGILVVTSWTRLRAEDFHDLINQIAERCAATGLRRVLADHSASTVRDISAEGVWAIAQYCTILNVVLAGGRLAIVFAEDVDFGVARMWENHVDGKLDFASHLFREPDSARTWLGGDDSASTLLR